MLYDLFSKRLQSISNILSCLPTKQTHMIKKAIHYFLQYTGYHTRKYSYKFSTSGSNKASTKILKVIIHTLIYTNDSSSEAKHRRWHATNSNLFHKVSRKLQADSLKKTKVIHQTKSSQTLHRANKLHR